MFDNITPGAKQYRANAFCFICDIYATLNVTILAAVLPSPYAPFVFFEKSYV